MIQFYSGRQKQKSAVKGSFLLWAPPLPHWFYHVFIPPGMLIGLEQSLTTGGTVSMECFENGQAGRQRQLDMDDTAELRGPRTAPFWISS